MGPEALTEVPGLCPLQTKGSGFAPPHSLTVFLRPMGVGRAGNLAFQTHTWAEAGHVHHPLFACPAPQSPFHIVQLRLPCLVVKDERLGFSNQPES